MSVWTIILLASLAVLVLKLLGYLVGSAKEFEDAAATAPGAGGLVEPERAGGIAGIGDVLPGQLQGHIVLGQQNVGDAE